MIEQQPGIKWLQRNINAIWLGRLKVADTCDGGTAVKAENQGQVRIPRLSRLVDLLMHLG